MRTCLALAPFTAEFEVELSFDKDEVLTVLDKQPPEGWLIAKNAAGKEGLVPESYLAPTEGDGADDAEGMDGMDGMEAMFEVGRARMLASFAAEEDGELSVTEGTVVTLLQPAGGLPEGWLYARLGEQEGLVPETYVEMIDDDGRPLAEIEPMDELREMGMLAAQARGGFDPDAYPTGDGGSGADAVLAGVGEDDEAAYFAPARQGGAPCRIMQSRNAQRPWLGRCGCCCCCCRRRRRRRRAHAPLPPAPLIECASFDRCAHHGDGDGGRGGYE